MMHQAAYLRPDHVVREVPLKREPEWDGTERRGIDGITLRLMAEVRATMERHEAVEDKKIEAIKKSIEENAQKSEERHKDLVARHEALSQSTMELLRSNNQTTREIHAMFKAAFPNGDAESHRRAHEAWIEKDKSEREFWLHLKKQVVGWGMTAVTAWAAMLLWAGFVKGPV